MIARTLIALVLSSACYGQMREQGRCSKLVKADIEKTRTESPRVYATIKTYTFEYSKSRDSCVIVMQYRVHDTDGSQKVQVLALNAVTMQSMAGDQEVYLIPAGDTQQVNDAADFLFRKYSH